MAISSPGLGSNLDVNGIVSQLMAIERQPVTRLGQKEATYQAKISAYGSIKGTLSGLQSALAALTSSDKYSAYTTSFSESGYAVATASSSAGKGSHSLEVNALAQAQKLVSNTFADTTSAIGTGTITIQYGTYDSGTNTFSLNTAKSSQTVTIDSQHSSLSGIRDAINAANINATASITNDGSGYRIVLTSKDTGAANSLKLSVSDPSLSALAYDPTGTKNLTQSIAAQDASIKLNGLTINKASNTITDAIDGVTLKLTKLTTSAVTLTVSQDTAAVSGSVSAFVKAYNDAQKAIKEVTAYDATQQKASVLTGDSSLRSIQTQMRNLLNTSIPNATGGLTTLSDIGVSFQKDGTLKLDSGKLQSVLNDPGKDIASLLAAIGRPSDALVKVIKSGSATQAGSYAINISQAASRGNVTGSAAPVSYSILAGTNDALSLSVDGTVASVTLAAGSYKPTALAAEIQSKINGASAFSGAGIAVSVGYNGTQGKATGSAAAGLTIDGTNNTLTLSVDGVASGTITLASGTYTATSLAAELQNKINADPTLAGSGKSVIVSQNNGVLTASSDSYGASSAVTALAGNALANLMGTPGYTSGTGSAAMIITSNRYGSGSTVSVSGNGADNLLGAGRTNNTGTDVNGTIGGQPATGTGQTLTSTAGGAAGIELQISGSSTGDRGTVTYSFGYAAQLAAKLDAFLATKGTISSRIDGISESVKDINRRRESLERRLVTIEKRYRAQFTSLDTLMSSLTKTSQYLQQQLANLPSASK